MIEKRYDEKDVTRPLAIKLREFFGLKGMHISNEGVKYTLEFIEAELQHVTNQLKSEEQINNRLHDEIQAVTKECDEWKERNKSQFETLTNTFKQLQESKQEVERLKEQIESLIKQNPCKVVGDRDSYSDYNQGWQDALGSIKLLKK